MNLINGQIIKPKTSITVPIILYIVLYIVIHFFITGISPSATGLYNEKIIADEIPSSETLSTCNIDENKLLIPAYSAPKRYMIIVLITNGNRIFVALAIKPIIIFRIVFTVLLCCPCIFFLSVC